MFGAQLLSAKSKMWEESYSAQRLKAILQSVKIFKNEKLCWKMKKVKRNCRF